MCEEKIFDTGSGATEYMLSQGNQNGPDTMISDSEGSPTDGSASDFFPESVCCNVSF